MKINKSYCFVRLVAMTSALFVFSLMTCVANAETKKQGAIEYSEKSVEVKSGSFSYRIEQQPTWVSSIQEEDKTRPKNAALFFAYIDEQLKVDKGSTEFYRHAMREVAEPTGLASAAQISAQFDPSYQSLAFHRLGIWRGSRYIDKLSKKVITLLQRETQLEYRIYNGQVTASIMLDDVRVGDRIEYSYTIRGANPVFNEKLVFTAWTIADSAPIIRYRLRLLAAPDRHINYLAGPDIVITKGDKGGLRETTFNRRDVPQAVYDPSTPDSTYLAAQIQLSEFSEWAEVARWGAKLFADVAATPSPTVRARAEIIRHATKDPEERLLQALDFVQNEVRYFGLEMGANSHYPAAPEKVIGQRFGDCKDKASLLVALLRELHIEADPVLVSMRLQGQVVAAITGPLAFDHAIVRVSLNGRTYWLDGTRSQQTGGLLDRQAMGFDKGLVLSASSTALAELPSRDSEERISVEEVLRITKFTSDPILESKITYHGDMAEYIRNFASSRSPSEFETRFSSDYARYYPGIKSVGALKLTEMPGRNAISIVQQFALPQFWTFPESRNLVGAISLWGINQAITRPDEVVRRNPLRIQFPGVHRHTFSIEYPEDVSQTSSSERFDDGDKYFSFNVIYDSQPRRAKVNAVIKISKTAVAPVDWPAYSEKLQKLKSSRFVASVNVPAVRLGQMEKLQKDLADLDEQLRVGKLNDKIKTRTQFLALAYTVSRTAQLESGRLNPVFRAQILRERGTQLNNQGLLKDAAADFNESLRLAPAEPRNYVSAAINAFFMEDDALATQYLDKAIELSPSDRAAHGIKILTDYFSGHYAASRENVLQLLSNPIEAEQSYPAIWLYLSSRRLGEDGTVAARRYLPVSAAPVWPYPVLQFFIGDASYEQALKAAGEGDRTTVPLRLCELYYYAGEKALLDGDDAAAILHFMRAVSTGVVEASEYTMAQRRLSSTRMKLLGKSALLMR